MTISSIARFDARYVVQTEVELLGDKHWANDSFWNDAADAKVYISMRQTFSDPKGRHLQWRISAN